MNVKLELKSRCVTGIPAYAGAAMAAVMPGTISKRRFAALSDFALFPAATEDKRIAALQSHDALALGRMIDQKLVDLVL